MNSKRIKSITFFSFLFFLITTASMTKANWTQPNNLNDFISLSEYEVENSNMDINNSRKTLIIWDEGEVKNWYSYSNLFKLEFENTWHGTGSSSEFINFINAQSGISNQKVVINDSGDAIIIWQMVYPLGPPYGRDFLFKSEYRNGVWDHPQSWSDSINADTEGQIYHSIPDVAISDNGDAVIVWHQRVEALARDQVFMVESRNGIWSTPARISLGNYFARDPKVTMDNNGNAIVLMNHGNGLLKSEYRDGAWIHPVSIDENICPLGTLPGHSQVKMSDDGYAIILWSGYHTDSSNYRIYKSEYINGTWHNPLNNTDALSLFISETDAPSFYVDVNNNGNAIVTWRQSPNLSSTKELYKAERKDSTWFYPASSNNFISVNGYSAEGGWTSIDDKGDIIILYSASSDGASYSLYKSEFRNNLWTHPLSIHDVFIAITSLSSFYNVSLSVSDNGHGIVLWHQEANDGKVHLFKSEYSNDGSELSTDFSWNLFLPAITKKISD